MTDIGKKRKEKKMIPHFPPLEVTTRDTLGALSFLLAQRASEISAVPATSTIAAYLVDERRRPNPFVKYLTGAPAEHLALLTPGEVPSPSTADGVVLSFMDGIAHNGFTRGCPVRKPGSLAHVAAVRCNKPQPHGTACCGGRVSSRRPLHFGVPSRAHRRSRLFVACHVGRLDIVKYLSDVKPALLDVGDNDG